MSNMLRGAVLALGAAASMNAIAQVKVFERPPSIEELRASLAARPAASAEPAPAAMPSGAPPEEGVRRRGIAWTTPAGNKPSADAAAQVAAPTRNNAAATLGEAPSVALPINFEPGSSRLAAGATAYIEPIASLLRADPGLRMAIEGHTDASGSPQRNLMLSWDRAMTVFKLLVERYGIDPQRLQPVGKGSLELMDAGNPDGAANRRVQFRPLG